MDGSARCQAPSSPQEMLALFLHHFHNFQNGQIKPKCRTREKHAMSLCPSWVMTGISHYLWRMGAKPRCHSLPDMLP